MGWSVYEGRSIGEHISMWDELNHELHGGHPLLDSSFILPLFRYFANSRVHLVVDREGGFVTGMGLIEAQGCGSWQIFTPGQAPMGPLMLAHSRREHFCGLFKKLPGYAWLVSVLKQDPLHPALDRHLEHANLERIPHQTTTNVAIKGTFEEYLQTRTGKLRNNMKRTFRKLDQAGIEPKLLEHRAVESVHHGVEVHGNLESRGWKGRAGTAISINNVQGAFYGETLCNFSRKNGARIFQLDFNGKICASLLTVVQDGMMVGLKKAYDEEYATYSPGRLIDYLMLERLFLEKEVLVLETYTNASREDLVWSTGSREVYHVNYFRNPLFKALNMHRRRIRSMAQL